MKIEYSTDKKIRPEELLVLAETQGWGNSRPAERNARAISGSIFIASARCNGQLIGILRLVGDGAYCLHIADFIVKPKYQKIGIGTKLLEMCLEYAKKVRIGIGDNIGEFTLFANISADKFYEKFGFLSAPNGMVLTSSEKRKGIETEFNRQLIKERKR
ncbi:MAG: GNAT family N-acetyltransferase [Candidatus Zixiibacteriota bacterium]